jgi:OFA family oxalate/formate antiporter-like MFS transporter
MNKRAYVVLAASVIMQVCMGATYSWSVFAQYLHNTCDVKLGTAQAPFSIFFVVFPAMTIVAGRLLERLGPTRMAMLGALVFAAGWFLAGLGEIHIVFSMIGMGVLGGLGVGLAYLVPIAAGMRWFPGRKGLVTGLAVAGFGGGAALISQVSEVLMGGHGLTPFATMRWLGLVFVLICLPAASLLRYPPGADDHAHRTSAPAGFLGERAFWLLYAAMCSGLAAGFTVNANLAQLNMSLGVKAGALAVALFAVANSVGRIAWGLMFDIVPARTAIRANLLGQAAVLAVHPWLLGSTVGLSALAMVAGFNYGGVLVLYASSAGRRWGARHVGRVYGWLFSSNMFAAAAPLLAGMAFDRLGTFRESLFVLAALLVAAAVCVRFEERPEAVTPAAGILPGVDVVEPNASGS